METARMRGTWENRILPAWAFAIALATGGRTVAESPAGPPYSIPDYGSSSGGASQRLQPAPIFPSPMLPAPSRIEDRVVPARWEAEAASVPRQSASPANLTKQPGALPLPPPANPSKHSPALPGKSTSRETAKNPADFKALFPVVSSLGIVIGVFLLGVWIFRRAAPQGMTRLPNEVFEILGRAPLAGRQQVHLLRCGSKLLLVSVMPEGAETLTEITDPLEVDRLAGFCRQAHPQSSSTAFRQVFEQLAPKNTSRGLFDRQSSGGIDLNGREWDGGGL
jgi:flagellar protein FliO/FliZ